MQDFRTTTYRGHRRHCSPFRKQPFGYASQARVWAQLLRYLLEENTNRKCAVSLSEGTPVVLTASLEKHGCLFEYKAHGRAPVGVQNSESDIEPRSMMRGHFASSTRNIAGRGREREGGRGRESESAVLPLFFFFHTGGTE